MQSSRAAHSCQGLGVPQIILNIDSGLNIDRQYTSNFMLHIFAIC